MFFVSGQETQMFSAREPCHKQNIGNFMLIDEDFRPRFVVIGPFDVNEFDGMMIAITVITVIIIMIIVIIPIIDLKLINNWAFQWKMNFNPDPTKQADEVIFSRKAKEIYHPPLVFNNTNVSQSSSQKHLGVILDSKLIFDEHLKMVSLKISKTLGLLRKLHNLLPRSTLKILSDPTLIMVIFFMIKLVICPFTINWNLFSIMPAWP